MAIPGAPHAAHHANFVCDGETVARVTRGVGCGRWWESAAGSQSAWENSACGFWSSLIALAYNPCGGNAAGLAEAWRQPCEGRGRATCNERIGIRLKRPKANFSQGRIGRIAIFLGRAVATRGHAWAARAAVGDAERTRHLRFAGKGERTEERRGCGLHTCGGDVGASGGGVAASRQCDACTVQPAMTTVVQLRLRAAPPQQPPATQNPERGSRQRAGPLRGRRDSKGIRQDRQTPTLLDPSASLVHHPLTSPRPPAIRGRRDEAFATQLGNRGPVEGCMVCIIVAQMVRRRAKSPPACLRIARLPSRHG